MQEMKGGYAPEEEKKNRLRICCGIWLKFQGKG
jgi:hypothetical protein